MPLYLTIFDIYNLLFCRQVSWLRHKDVKLLSVGTYLYTTVNKQILQIKLELVPDFFLFNFGTWSIFTFLYILKNQNVLFKQMFEKTIL